MGVSKKDPVVRVPIDYAKLRGRIIEFFGTQGAFAQAIGWSEKSVSDWLNNKKYFPYEAILSSVEVLEIQHADVGSYFFTKLVQAS